MQMRIKWRKLDTRYFNYPVYEYQCECHQIALVGIHPPDSNPVRCEMMDVHCYRGIHLRTEKKLLRTVCVYCKKRIK